MMIRKGPVESAAPLRVWEAGMFIGPGKYTISSLHIVGRCLDIASEIAHRDEGRVQQWNCNGAAYQQWMIEEDADQSGRYIIHALLGRNKVLGIAGDSRDDFARIVFQPPRGSPFQCWRFVHEGGKAYRIFNEGSGLCIDFREEHRAPGGDLQQRPRLDFTNQLWSLNPA